MSEFDKWLADKSAGFDSMGRPTAGNNVNARRDVAYDSFWPDCDEDKSVYGIWCAAWKACEEAKAPVAQFQIRVKGDSEHAWINCPTEVLYRSAMKSGLYDGRALYELAESVPPEQQREHKGLS